ncbi:MAG: GMP/IMP nucleotidase [Sinobacteraceae bacterium]|nr:GMP/IMP nucleotidase [Nevskiaceae bacterium]
MRMCQHNFRARAAQHGERRLERRPVLGDVPRFTVAQPLVKGGADIRAEACVDQRSRQMQAGWHRRSRTGDGGECPARQRFTGTSCAVLETLANIEQSLAALFTDRGQVRVQGAMIEPGLQAYDMYGLAVPTRGDFHAGGELQACQNCRGSSLSTTLERVVIRECRPPDTALRRQVHQGSRSEHAVGVQAVQVQIGNRGGAHPRYHRRMDLPAAARPDWSAIDTVLLDLDGTLLDLAFDNFIWLGRVPEIFAERHGLSLAETHAQLAPRFRRVAGTLEWYSIDYWSRELGIDIEAVHNEEAARVAWLPGARNFLERVRESGKKLVLLTNSHPAILQIKHRQTGVLNFLDSAYTSHGFGAPKEDPRFWQTAQATVGFDPQRSLFADDSAAVLHAAIRAGIGYVYGVRRPDSSRDPHAHEEFESIDGVNELLAGDPA